KVFDATGMNKDKDVDYAALRKDKPTLYVFVAADKWDRPMARFLKTIDTQVQKDFEGVYVVAVWLTDDKDKTKEYLPKAQMSVMFEATALTCADGKASPKDWGVNDDAHVTVVIAAKGKVTAALGYKSVNETDVRGVIA